MFIRQELLYSQNSCKMNIIKIQDKMHPSDTYFNEHLKGKYCWWPRLQWVVPFDVMTDEKYAEAEQVPDAAFVALTKQEGWYKLYDIIEYVDDEKTNCVNSIQSLKAFNTFTPDADITIDELRKFRTWIAESLIGLGEEDPDTLHMLEYYKGGMWDEVCQGLSAMLAYNENTLANIRSFDSRCSCCGTASTLASLYSSSGSSDCDPLALYRKGVYQKMTMTFSDINYWINRPTELLSTFKSYIDNMLKIGLIPSAGVSNGNRYVDCTCTYTDDSAAAKAIMERLSKALGYIINCQVSGHKNYISDAFTDWSAQLYESMEWTV